MNISIKKIMGHYEVYDNNNNFLFSCDDEHELQEDLKSLGEDVCNVYM